jgi:bifunctional non-homologous end joining protein LigD
MWMRSPLARERRRPAGFIKPCQPTISDKPRSGPLWLHEIKHDGYRMIACKNGGQVRLWSRNGRDWSREFLAVTDAVKALPADEIVIDGEAMAHCKDGWPDFHGLRSEDGGAAACLFAFDLLRLNGEDLRPLPLDERRARLRKAIRGADKALRFSEHLDGDGDAIFRHACALGLEGIVSKRRDARYRSGRSCG